MNGLHAMLNSMAHSGVRNYATPGLSSFLIGGAEKYGKVRMFQSDRDTRDWIAPHTHRYDFLCYVISGTVENILFKEVEYGYDTELANKFAICKVTNGPKIGDYDVNHMRTAPFIESSMTYSPGETYDMTSDEYHSIRFSKGAVVLFFEGPQKQAFSYMLEPYSNGARVETFASSAWMFRRD